MIKKYWKILLSILAGIAGIFFLLSKNDTKKAKQAKKKIDDNNKKIDTLDVKIQEVKKQKTAVKKKVTTNKTAVKDLKNKNLNQYQKK